MSEVRFPADDGTSLDGDLRLPDVPAIGSAVLCHAHPRHGGSKDHPILWALRAELSARGFVVLGFDFRGNMRSAGTYGGGHAELADVRGAISRAREACPDGPTVVAGWSFGANVALREAVDDERVGGLALIGLPLRPGELTLPPLPDRTALRALRRPVLLVAGEGDTFCPEPDLRAFASGLPDAEVLVVAGTDHFLWRHERETGALVGNFAARITSRSD